MRGLVVAGTASGVGKTVATLALCRALQREGQTVQPAKAGPDFIDPSHHTATTWRASRTLDPWLQGADGLRENYARGEGDVCVVEGMMGLYDGSGDREADPQLDTSTARVADGRQSDTSTARVAELLDLPVVLVVDGSAGMESVAATAVGFERYVAHTGHDVDVAGVVTTRVHGGRHERGIASALPDELTYFGRIPPRDDLIIPERHLGLVLGEESSPTPDALDAAADCLDVDRLLDASREATAPDGVSTSDSRRQGRESESGSDADARPRVAVADDAAFRFVYPATRERLRARATVVPFAPTAGDDLPDCDGVYFPGGYPELHAETLASSPALATLADRAAEGLPVLGECGGLMALAESLTTADGESYEMAGVLPADVRMTDRYQALDHVELESRDGTLTADAGTTLHGHEFHYSEADVGDDARFAFDVKRGAGVDGERDGLTEYRTLGTYAHVHAASGAFDRFVAEL
ncbi:cobyrinic acid a,c-diamide synthase [Halogranum amylolyticum]|uniref:Cobyrinate a,c-diamide synthase n=1 Tax=Halogranum amylolyticum TaxID=660520 RepID=A0A1H8W019_9EURY|nr:cobyrinic acid a,c-diamide synthase [Halogranum amylolyticum]SEP20940.1 cobyrinic acid a,c-diamide synthase [Halogranum amylolyticum]